MRIILFAGKGGVGKTSIAAATGVKTALQGLRTLVISADPAHSLSDAFDLNRTLMDKGRGLPFKISESLWIQELDIQEELQKNWGEVQRYVSALLNTTGIEEIAAEELAILPGMEEISILLHINKYWRAHLYDVIILDCAPTGESIRFVSIPTALEWYMKKVFKLERRIARYMRPIAKRISDVPLPEDSYFDCIEHLFRKLEGIDRLLTNPDITTVRLVTNPEKMVLKETQRAFMFFNLYKLCIDAIIINRILPQGIKDSYFNLWKDSQETYINLAIEYFSPIPIFKVNLSDSEVLGYKNLERLAEEIYGDKNPAEIFYSASSYNFFKKDGTYILRLNLPFVTKNEVELNKIGDELVIRVGGFKKHIILPRSFALSKPKKAKVEGKTLIINFGGKE